MFVQKLKAALHHLSVPALPVEFVGGGVCMILPSFPVEVQGGPVVTRGVLSASTGPCSMVPLALAELGHRLYLWEMSRSQRNPVTANKIMWGVLVINELRIRLSVARKLKCGYLMLDLVFRITWHTMVGPFVVQYVRVR